MTHTHARLTLVDTPTRLSPVRPLAAVRPLHERTTVADNAPRALRDHELSLAITALHTASLRVYVRALETRFRRERLDEARPYPTEQVAELPLTIVRAMLCARRTLQGSVYGA